MSEFRHEWISSSQGASSDKYMLRSNCRSDNEKNRGARSRCSWVQCSVQRFGRRGVWSRMKRGRPASASPKQIDLTRRAYHSKRAQFKSLCQTKKIERSSTIVHSRAHTSATFSLFASNPSTFKSGSKPGSDLHKVLSATGMNVLQVNNIAKRAARALIASRSRVFSSASYGQPPTR